MARPSKYSPELRERAVRMVLESEKDYPHRTAAIKAVAGMLGIGSSEQLRQWVRQAEVDQGMRPGVTTEEAVEIKRLKRENAELRRANEILKAASAYVGDRVHRRASASFRGRADLQGLARARPADRPEQLLRPASPPALRPCAA